MEKLVIYLLLFVGYLIFKAVTASNKDKEKRQAKATNFQTKSAEQGEDEGQIFKDLGLGDIFAELKKTQEQKNTPKQVPAQTSYKDPQQKHLPQTSKHQPMKTAEPFLKGEIAQSRKGHFSETAIVEEYKRVHSQGKQLEHHVHHYVNEEEFKDKRQIENQRRSDKKQLEAYDERLKKMRTSSVHKIMRNKKAVRQAWLIKEVLDPPYIS